MSAKTVYREVRGPIDDLDHFVVMWEYDGLPWSNTYRWDGVQLQVFNVRIDEWMDVDRWDAEGYHKKNPPENEPRKNFTYLVLSD